MRIFVIIALAALLQACTGACYVEDRNADGTWPAHCADRFNSHRPR